MRRIDLAFIRLHVIDEFLEVLGRKVFPRDDQDRGARHQPDRLEIGFRIIGEVRIERGRGGMRAHMPHDDRVAIGRGALGARGARRPAGAHHVFNDERLAERLGHVIADDARDHVGGSAGGERHDQRDRAVRVVLGGGRQRTPSQTERCEYCDKSPSRWHTHPFSFPLSWLHVSNRAAASPRWSRQQTEPQVSPEKARAIGSDGIR